MKLKTGSYFILVFLVISLLSCKSEAEKISERNTIIDSTLTQFQKNYFKNEFDSLFLKTKFNGAISIKKEQEILYEKYNGFENFQRKNTLNSESVFAIASLSKQFTAVLILLLEEHNKLKVTDKVSKYLTDFQSAEKEEITIHQLLNHTSGLSDLGEGLQSKPGKEFNYSNKGFRFLGEIIAKVSEKSLDENLEELFLKAGMKHTSTANLFKDEDFAGANLGTSEKQESVAEMPKRLAKEDISVAAGGILSTIDDLHLWNENLYQGKILKPELLQKMITKSSSREQYILGKVGYGYGIMLSESSPQIYFHTGYVKGSPSLMMYYPESKTSVVILSNLADESKGKNAIFIPHKSVKSIADKVEISINQLKNEMIKSKEEK